MDAISCANCGADLGPVSKRAAFISLFVMGDERIDSWFWCAPCGVWTVEEYDDRFMGETTVSVRGPVPKEEGDRIVALIRKCPAPGDKWCECETHKTLR